MSSHAAGPRRVHRSVATGLPLALAAVLVAAGTATAAPSGDARVIRTATLGEIPLGSFSNALLPGSVADDHGIKLGGIGSDIYPAGRKGEYWTVTDRGPNGQIKVDGKKRRTFPVPGFDPAIVRIRVSGDTIKVIGAIPLTTSSGKAVTGLPNQKSRDEAPYTYDAQTPLSYDRTASTPRASFGPVTAVSGSWTSTGRPSCTSPRAGRSSRATCPRGSV